MHTAVADRLEVGEDIGGSCGGEPANIGVKQCEAVGASLRRGLERSDPIGEDGFRRSERGGRRAGLR